MQAAGAQRAAVQRVVGESRDVAGGEGAPPEGGVVPTLGVGLPVVAPAPESPPAIRSHPQGRVGLGLPRVGGSSNGPPAQVQRVPSSGGDAGGPVLGMASALRVLSQQPSGLGLPEVGREVVQRVEAVPETPSAPEPEPVPQLGQAPQEAQEAQAPQAQQAQQQQQQAVEPEELLKKLYDPLLRRLKAELWLDRERRGLLTDRWH